MRRDGEEFPCELTITRLAAPGNPLFIGYVRDITDRRRAEAELRASRARIVEAGDAARRRLERDLHDGAQQHLVGLALTLRLAREGAAGTRRSRRSCSTRRSRTWRPPPASCAELARGIHPAVLTEGGLEPALAGLAGRVPIPVVLDAPCRRSASPARRRGHGVLRRGRGAHERGPARRRRGGRRVTLALANGRLHVEVSDDGRGGADPRAAAACAGSPTASPRSTARFAVPPRPAAGRS